MSTSDNENATQKDQVQQIVSGLKTLDTSAASGLNLAARIQQARVSQSTRTLKSLTTKYGTEDSRVKALSAEIDASNIRTAKIQAARMRILTPQTKADDSGWLLQGQVLDAQYKPLARHTVFLVDAKKTYLQQYGFAYTDKDGSFELNFSGKEESSSTSMFIEVVNEKANPVYLSQDAFAPESGSTNYQQIVLDQGEPDLGDPPAEIRKIAMPKKTDKM